MQIDCPRCRRVLEYSGDRPSFCAYCGSSLAVAERPVRTLALPDGGTGSGVDPGATQPVEPSTLSQTAEYRPGQREGRSSGDEEFPEQIAGYRLVRKLGAGGMGTVFEAEDETQAQRVALKLIKRDQIGSREAVERFRQEGRLASAVTHPRCVFVLAVDEFQGAPYIVMEFMPGTTLQTMVETTGTLDPATAILKIFDVIEGLQQFHNRGLIHRDVKPSNCFLDEQGRVKIGDFGLSKSLEGGADLTRTGSFVGTPLYASPEQIKRDELDERTDVYSVAATLYYLLAGRPPVQAKDAAEALARIVSEPAPPLRGHRPDISRALEAVIHRGLERDPARRWRSLQELHDALLPFVPRGSSMAGIGLRLGAFCIDLGLAYLVNSALSGIIILFHHGEFFETQRFLERNAAVIGWIRQGIWFFYFAALEGLTGASAGKWLLGLRVTAADRGGPAGLGRVLLRTLVFVALTELPALLVAELEPANQGAGMFIRFWALGRIVKGLGLVALVSTMRKRNGFRGPHEWLSGTRVVQTQRFRRRLPGRRLRALSDSRLATSTTSTAPPALDRIGPYLVRGAIRWQPDQKIVLGHDSTLERPVWIVLREGTAPPSPARRSLSRHGRPRWIGGGEHAGGRWDAFTSPSGIPLGELAGSEGLGWGDVLPMLRQLAAELEAARDDATLPRRLSLDQVWIQPDGGVQLVDIFHPSDSGSLLVPDRPAAPDPAGGSTRELPGGSFARGSRDHELLEFIAEVARLALEGSGRRPAKQQLQPGVQPAASEQPEPGTASGRISRRSAVSGRRIQAAVPEHARWILDRLTETRAPFSSLQSLRVELDTAAVRPAEISLVRRAVHLGIQGLFLLPGLAGMLALSRPVLELEPEMYPNNLTLLAAIPGCWIVWAFLTRGGLSFSVAGIALARKDGRRASRLACGLRALLVWMLPTVLLAGASLPQHGVPEDAGLAHALWLGAVLLLAVYLAIGLRWRHRGPHDWLAGTTLVPL